MLNGYGGQFLPSKNAVIAASGTKSAAIPLNGFVPVGIYFPATFTGTAVTFEACDTEDGTYRPVYNSAGAVSYTIAQARFYALDPKDFAGINFLKIVSGATEGAERTLVVALKG